MPCLFYLHIPNGLLYPLQNNNSYKFYFLLDKQ